MSQLAADPPSTDPRTGAELGHALHGPAVVRRGLFHHPSGEPRVAPGHAPADDRAEEPGGMAELSCETHRSIMWPDADDLHPPGSGPLGARWCGRAGL